MDDKIVNLVAAVARAFVARNHLRAAEVPDFLASLHKAFAGLDEAEAIAMEKPRAAVDLSWKKTIRSDYLISFIDGERYKMLRRHLAVNGLTPEEYRARYDLPRDYPMVAAAYSKKRSALATAAELGQQRRKPNAVAAPAQSV